MYNLILFDDNQRTALLPLSFTRPCGEMRIGILTIREKWERRLDSEASYLTEKYLSDKFPASVKEENLFINSRLLPNNIIENISSLQLGQGYVQDSVQLIAKGKDLDSIQWIEYDSTIDIIKRPYDLFSKNADQIQQDFTLITKNRKSAILDTSNQRIAPENIFIEEGATIQCSILNASKGPIYIGKDAEIMEGTVIRGPFAMCENSVLKLSTKIYGATTLGPYCKVGGEVNNSILFGYSSKAHDGFLGNSVLGEWCNLGADTNNSNLKNNYAEVKLWDYTSQRFAPSGLQFCGLIMGDHSKCGINTMFNTGTVVGVSANVFGGGFPRNFIPSFSWGGSTGFMTYRMKKVEEVAKIVMQRRNKTFDETERRILEEVFSETSKFRTWEKN